MDGCLTFAMLIGFILVLLSFGREVDTGYRIGGMVVTKVVDGSPGGCLLGVVLFLGAALIGSALFSGTRNATKSITASGPVTDAPNSSGSSPTPLSLQVPSGNNEPDKAEKVERVPQRKDTDHRQTSKNSAKNPATVSDNVNDSPTSPSKESSNTEPGPVEQATLRAITPDPDSEYIAGMEPGEEWSGLEVNNFSAISRDPLAVCVLVNGHSAVLRPGALVDASSRTLVWLDSSGSRGSFTCSAVLISDRSDTVFVPAGATLLIALDLGAKPSEVIRAARCTKTQRAQRIQRRSVTSCYRARTSD